MLSLDLTDKEYEVIKDFFSSETSNKFGRPRKANRSMINGILWILRGGKWSNLPRRYGAKSTVHDRFKFWQKDGTWKKIYERICELRPSLKREKIDILEKEKKINKKLKPTRKPIKNNKEELLDKMNYWADEFNNLECILGKYFARSESRKRVMEYIKGLFSLAKRKNSWQLAEASGDKTPYGFQYLLGRSRWNADSVCTELQNYVKENMNDDDGVLVVDETSFIKKGIHSAGVAYQYSGLKGCVTNCQIGVFVTYATKKGHVLLDRELYLPKEWIENKIRMKQVGIPFGKEFYTKPELACRIFDRIFDSGISAKWITGDSVYGSNGPLRIWLQERKKAYVLSVTRQEYVAIKGKQHDVATIFNSMLSNKWLCLSAGDGSKGPRYYHWQWLPLSVPSKTKWAHWLLVRRSIKKPSEMRAYIVFAPSSTTLEEVVRVAGARWTVEVCFEDTKEEVGLDHYEVRSWKGWYRHITLAMWAYALLVIIRGNLLNTEPSKKNITKKNTLLVSENTKEF